MPLTEPAAWAYLKEHVERWCKVRKQLFLTIGLINTTDWNRPSLHRLDWLAAPLYADSPWKGKNIFLDQTFKVIILI